MKNSSTMVCNIKVKVEVKDKVKMLQIQYGNNVYSTPSSKVRRVFQERSLDNAPKSWHLDPTFADV